MPFSALKPQQKYSTYKSKSIFIIYFLRLFFFVFFSFVLLCFSQLEHLYEKDGVSLQLGIKLNTSTQKQSDFFFLPVMGLNHHYA